MSTLVKADASGAVTIPAELCQAAGIAAGGEVVAELQNGQILLQRLRRPIWERIAARAAEIPPEELDKVPADGSAQIDHYLYGHPKRPE